MALITRDIIDRQTTTQELFPMNNPVKSLASSIRCGSGYDSDQKDEGIVQSAIVPHYLNNDVSAWSVDDVQRWLRFFELDTLMGTTLQY